MGIKEIRDTINHLIWSRTDLSGATQDEFRRMNVRDRLTKCIDEVRQLEIKPRFTHEIESAQRAIESALKMIEKWESMQTKQKDQPHVYH